jgi:hypothetical protein
MLLLTGFVAVGQVHGAPDECVLRVRQAMAHRLDLPEGTWGSRLYRAAKRHFLAGGAPEVVGHWQGARPAVLATLTVQRECFTDALSKVAYQDALPVSGGTPPYSFLLLPGFDRLPAGLAFDRTTGAIAGMPKDTRGLPFKVPLTVVIRDAAGEVLAVMTRLRVRDPYFPADPAPECP